MTKSESLQHKLERVRAPRVRITYDVETGGGMETKEIPFVVGVLADLSGKPDHPLPKLKERSFVEVDRDNIDPVLEGMRPRAAFRVPNRLAKDGSQLAVELCFKNLDDFHPEKVALQLEPLRRLVEARNRLSDLLGRLDGNDRLEQLLQEALSSPERLKLICEEAKSAKGPDTESAG
jgi:type VI secretion system protein ImpB